MKITTKRWRDSDCDYINITLSEDMQKSLERLAKLLSSLRGEFSKLPEVKKNDSLEVIYETPGGVIATLEIDV